MPSFGHRTSSTVPASVMMPRLLLLLAILCLTIIGCVMIYSSSIAQAMEAGTSAFSYLRDQLIFVVVGVVFAAIIWKFLPCSIWRGPSAVDRMAYRGCLAGARCRYGHCGLGRKAMADFRPY